MTIEREQPENWEPSAGCSLVSDFRLEMGGIGPGATGSLAEGAGRGEPNE